MYVGAVAIMAGIAFVLVGKKSNNHLTLIYAVNNYSTIGFKKIVAYYPSIREEKLCILPYTISCRLSATAMEGSSEKPVKITLAEDDKDDQELFKEAVERSGTDADIKTVNNGQELIDQLRDDKEKPDIIFLDINMPVKNGKEALKEIKGDEELKDIPAVILSTSDHPKDIQESFNAGADLYIQKPNSLYSFIRILKQVFSFHWASKLLGTAWKRLFMSERNPDGGHQH
ncbi:MAG: response regulator [Chitinophagaceae bacterium]